MKVLLFPSGRDEGAEEDVLGGRVAGRSGGGVREDPDSDRGGQPGHAGLQVHPGYVLPTHAHCVRLAQRQHLR